ncbi:unnamed protein product, partial [Rotaria sordida]
YLLPEFVVIHHEPSVLIDIQSLKDFVREDLNVHECLLTIIDEVPMESEDVHIVYCVAKQIQFEVTAEQGI